MNPVKGGIIFLLLLVSGGAYASIRYEKIDSLIKVRDNIIDSKREYIKELENMVGQSQSDEVKLEVMDIIFNEYCNISFDSALWYADKIYKYADEKDNIEYKNSSILNRALLYVHKGDYEKADKLIEKTDPQNLSRENLQLYRSLVFMTELYSHENPNDLTKDHHSAINSKHRADSIIEMKILSDEKNSTEFFLDKARKISLNGNNPDSAIYYFTRFIEKTPVNSVPYASVAYSIAQAYKQTGNKDLYREWLTNAAISELQVPSVKNAALRELAMMIFEEDPKNSERAIRYLTTAIENSLYHDDKMEMKEIAETVPSVLSGYSKLTKDLKNNMNIILIAVAPILIILILLSINIRKQNIQVQSGEEKINRQTKYIISLKSQLEIKEKNLNLMYEELKETQQELQKSNRDCKYSAQLWLDIFASHLNKKKDNQNRPIPFKKFQKEDKQKNADASSSISNDTEEIRIFLSRFDNAILGLYPDFVKQINALLKPENQIMTKTPENLNTELRICALIRLGIKESSEIANLLLASVQTIYNNRTKIRNKALDKDRFEDLLQKIDSMPKTLNL